MPPEIVAIQNALYRVSEAIFQNRLPPSLQALLAQSCRVEFNHKKKIIKIHCPSRAIAAILFRACGDLSNAAHFADAGKSFVIYADGVNISPLHEFSVRTGQKIERIEQYQRTKVMLNQVAHCSVFEGLPDRLDLSSIVSWMFNQTAPLALTPNDTHITLAVNPAYAEWTGRPLSHWLCDTGNPGRFPEGELGKLVRGVVGSKNGVTDCEFIADKWDTPGVPHTFVVDAREVMIDDRSFRLVYSKHRELLK